jgi:hypothetical protein
VSTRSNVRQTGLLSVCFDSPDVIEPLMMATGKPIAILFGALLFTGSLSELDQDDRLDCDRPRRGGGSLVIMAKPIQDALCSIPKHRDSGRRPFRAV